MSVVLVIPSVPESFERGPIVSIDFVDLLTILVGYNLSEWESGKLVVVGVFLILDEESFLRSTSVFHPEV